jgi:Tfp pilus assembly PilM family ATPase
MSLKFLGSERAVGLDMGTGSIKALALERRRSELTVVGRGAISLEGHRDFGELSQAIHAVLADCGADGEPVIAAIGGPDVVIRQVSLPPVPGPKILPALELQHRELGLLPPRDSITDAQVLRRSRKDPNQNEILSVSVPKVRLDERIRVLKQAAVDVQMLDVEPLALLNGAIQLTGLDAGELLVLLTVGDRTSVLCLFSDQGPVVARYLDVGAETLAEQLRAVLPALEPGAKDGPRTISPVDMPKAEAACRESVERMTEDIRLSLTFYRTEYDRESLPRYAIGGSVRVPYLGRWVADRLGLGAPLELLDPFRVVDVRAPQTSTDLTAAGPQFLQAFGLALRGL